MDVADKLWRLTRAQRWEIHGYSRPEHGGEPSEEADWILVLAGEDRKGAAVLRQLPDPSISAEDLLSPFVGSLSISVPARNHWIDWTTPTLPRR